MKNTLFDISGKVIAITGGYGILGSDIARYLASQGAKLVILGRSKDKGGALISKIKAEGNDAIFLSCDVTNKEMLEQNCSDIISTYGKLDVLINAAGGNIPGATIPPDKTILDLDIDAFGQVMDLNLLGTVLPTIVFSKAMIKVGAGNIINISSESAMRPLTRVAGYSAAKAAISNWTKYLAGELALKYGEKFRVNAVAPGFFITDQNRTLLTNTDGSYTDRAKTILAHTPYNRFGDAEELRGSFHYLISDASKFVTGTVLVVDGGFDAFSI